MTPKERQLFDKTESRIWLLGAADPEMQEIESLLRECGERVEYATEAPERYRVQRSTPRTVATVWESDSLAGCPWSVADGPQELLGGRRWLEYLVHGQWTTVPARVSARTAYKCEVSSSVDDLRGRGGSIYFVECRPRDERYGLDKTDCAAMLHSIGHHRPGDPGFGRGPEDFLTASSLGQVIAELARFQRLPDSWYSTPIPKRLVVVAGCDHCLHHAWSGRCPGVTREDVREYRANLAETRPVEPKSREQYLADFASTLEALDGGARPGLAVTNRVWLGYSELSWVDTREVGYLPELSDVACYVGVAYLANALRNLPYGAGERKVVLGGATTPEMVQHFMRVWAPARGLTDIYGDPARGFAGGYLP